MRFRTAARAASATAALIMAMALPAKADNRTIDGWSNNLTDPSMGAAGTQLLRTAPSDYSDLLGLSGMAGDTRPSPRMISNMMFDQTTNVESTMGLSNFTWAWGQFLDHDIDLTPGTGTEIANVNVPTGDIHFDPFNTGAQTIHFDRSVYAPTTGITSPREQMNVVTSWIDGSNVYGSDLVRAAYLRSGVDGKLKMDNSAVGDLLPKNLLGLDNASQPFQNPTDLFIAGDVRANEHVVLTSMHTLFAREHNRLADQIALENPTWTDEQIYQKARKLVGAEIQAVTYNEFLPALGVNLNPYAGYDDSVDGSIANEFSTAAYRFGHSMLSSPLLRLNEDGTTIAEGNINLFDAFFSPHLLETEGGIEPLLRGLAGKTQQQVDTKVVDDVRNILFGPPGAGGSDLVSLNIQRGRDHGLSDYNAIRVAYGLSAITSFSEITSDTSVANTLATLYGSVDNIDPWVGFLAEDHVSGAAMGETILAILMDQFMRLRDGDAFFFLNDTDLSPEEIAWLSDLQLSDVILANTDINWIQDNVFFTMVRTPEPATALLAGLGLLTILGRRPRRQRVA